MLLLYEKQPAVIVASYKNSNSILNPRLPPKFETKSRLDDFTMHQEVYPYLRFLVPSTTSDRCFWLSIRAIHLKLLICNSWSYSAAISILKLRQLAPVKGDLAQMVRFCDEIWVFCWWCVFFKCLSSQLIFVSVSGTQTEFWFSVLHRFQRIRQKWWDIRSLFRKSAFDANDTPHKSMFGDLIRFMTFRARLWSCSTWTTESNALQPLLDEQRINLDLHDMHEIDMQEI